MTDQIDRHDPNRVIFHIPERNMSRLDAEIEKLSQKAKRMMGFEFGAIVVGMYDRKVGDTVENIYEVYLDVDPIKFSGWTFVARIDHSQETGNIIRHVPNVSVDIDAKYRTAKPYCDHCNSLRKRRDTFLLHNDETGEFKQVGSTCIADFLGHDVKHLGRLAELLGYAKEAADAAEKDENHIPQEKTLYDRRYIGLENFLAYVAQAVRLYGWVSGKAAYECPNLTSTRDRACDAMFTARRFNSEQPTDEDREVVAQALAWAQDFANKPELDEYQHNVLVVANALYIEGRSTGLAASIVGCYLREQDRLSQRQSFADIARNSTHLAIEGAKVKTVPARVLTMKYLDTGSVLCKFLTREGQLLSWFATGKIDFEKDTDVVLSGTVKRHSEYRGTKETLMSRCRVVTVL